MGVVPSAGLRLGWSQRGWVPCPRRVARELKRSRPAYEKIADYAKVADKKCHLTQWVLHAHLARSGTCERSESGTQLGYVLCVRNEAGPSIEAKHMITLTDTDIELILAILDAVLQ